MGSFKNQPTLKYRVCKKCDREIGKCEEQLIKCGPEALFRIILGIIGRSGSTSTSPFHRKHAGSGPIECKVKYPNTDYEVLVELIPGTGEFQPLSQIVLIGSDGQCEQILFTDKNATSRILKERISSIKLVKPWKIWLFGMLEEEQEIALNLLKAEGINIGEELKENIQPCNEPVESITTVQVDKKYFRAVVKVSFHYFINYSEYFSGSEPTFEAVRRFIRYGEGEIDCFVRQRRGNLVRELSKNFRPKYYGHFLIGSFCRNIIHGKVQFFIGHDSDPPYFEVILARNPFSISLPPETFGHFYVYFSPDKRKQYDGKMEKLGVSQRIIFPSCF